jgi:hypothetical protein
VVDVEDGDAPGGQAVAGGAMAVLPSAREVMVASGWNMLAADATHQHQLISPPPPPRTGAGPKTSSTTQAASGPEMLSPETEEGQVPRLASLAEAELLGPAREPELAEPPSCAPCTPRTLVHLHARHALPEEGQVPRSASLAEAELLGPAREPELAESQCGSDTAAVMGGEADGGEADDPAVPIGVVSAAEQQQSGGPGMESQAEERRTEEEQARRARGGGDGAEGGGGVGAGPVAGADAAVGAEQAQAASSSAPPLPPQERGVRQRPSERARALELLYIYKGLQ